MANPFVLGLVILGPILLTALASGLLKSVSFGVAPIFKLYLTMLFGVVGIYGHLLHPSLVVELIPPIFPLRAAATYASGVLELAFAALIWTRWARIIGWAIILYLALVLPFNIYGWTVPTNVPNYLTSPLYLWIRVPLQAVFMAFAYYGTRETRAGEVPSS